MDSAFCTQMCVERCVCMDLKMREKWRKVYMKSEIELAKPTYIMACGSMAAALFNNKSKPSDLIGRKEYFAEMDATVFYAFNPNILYFRPEEDERLIKIVNELAIAVEAS